MAGGDRKITQLAAAPSVDNEHTFFAVKGGDNVKITASQLSSYINAGADKSFSINFTDVASSLSVEHSLGKIPSVVILNTSKVKLYGIREVHTDNNNVTFNWVGTFSGSVHFN